MDNAGLAFVLPVLACIGLVVIMRLLLELWAWWDDRR